MSPAQIELAFRRLFGAEPTANILRLDMVTPGDLMVVARKAKVMQITDVKSISAMVSAEVALKPGASRQIGFV
jgi:hypothetical protein